MIVIYDSEKIKELKAKIADYESQRKQLDRLINFSKGMLKRYERGTFR